MNTRNGLLLCSAAALLAFTGSGRAAAAAAPGQAAAPQSYAELLAPIPNATALLKTDDAQREARPAPLQVAQFRHHHHHHHHHHFGFGFYGGGVGPYYYGPAYYYGPNCYWTWGRWFWNGWRWAHRRIRVCN
jgi:hypothetical protein